MRSLLLFLLLFLLLGLSGMTAPFPPGLAGHYGFDGHLLGSSPSGHGQTAQLARPSRAFDDRLRPVFANEPVFAAGRYGEGILVAPGVESKERHAFQNLLPPAAAEFTADGGDAWRTVGDARWRLDQGSRALEGEVFLVAESAGGQGGVELADPVRSLGGDHALSLFARSEGGRPLRAAVLDANGGELATAEWMLANTWRRFELLFAAGTFTRDTKAQTRPELRVRLTGADFAVDAMQLEFLGGYSYAGTRSASLWQPGRAYRAGDVLSLPDIRRMAGRNGTLAFWCQPRGRQSRRVLCEIPTGNRWEPTLQLSLLNDTRWTLASHAAEKPLAKSWDRDSGPDAWHHVAMGWQDGQAVAWIDGERALAIEGLRWPDVIRPPRLGSAGPNAAANAVIDECAVYDRLLDDDEIRLLANRADTLEGEFSPALVIRPARLLHTISRTLVPQPWRCEIANASGRALRDVRAEFRLGPVVREQRLGTLAAGTTKEVEFRFVPDLTAGRHPLVVTATSGNHEPSRLRAEVEVTRALAPFENLQVAPWGRNANREHGFTIGGGDIEEAMRDGLAHGPLYHYLGYPRTTDGRDQVAGMNGKPGNVNVRENTAMREQLAREAERIARQLAETPSARAITLNSEMQWIWSHDFSPERKAFVERTFGLDLGLWQNPPDGQVDRFLDPYGRLKPSAAGIALPPDRVLPADSPLYAYHRWFHGIDGPTESLFNQAIADRIHRYRPELLTVWEPILRRCAVRAFDRIAIAQEWFYYEDPMHAVSVQERLNAAVRGTRLRPTGMPQFLFKPGRAAPHAGVATGDMFRETAWLCALQPIRMMTYWNFGVVPSADFADHYNRCMTKEQLDELFGTPAPTWEQAQAVLKANPKLANLMPWTPGLVAAFARFHNEEVGPLAALVPRWRNHPRRVALLESFASQIHREVRWPKRSWLEQCAMHAGLPYDILWDEDFERGADPLSGYELVLVPETVCLTTPAFVALERFAKRGGTILVDPETKIEIPGATRLVPGAADADFEQRLAARERALLERHGAVSSPQYVEAMEEAAALPGRVDPEFLSLVEQRVRPPARSTTPNTWLNLLEAEGVHYLGIVNDLRTRGPMYGHFGKIRETGVPQTATVLFDAELGAVAYDVLAQERLFPQPSKDGRQALELRLPPAGARLLLLARNPIERLTLGAEQAATDWEGQAGRELRIQAELRDERGRLFPGLVPAVLAIRRPDGSEDDFSRAIVFAQGRFSLRVPLPRDFEPGPWSVEIQERAAGTTARAVAEP